MSIALLTYPLSSQNQRVEGFEVFGDEQPRVYSTDNQLAGSDMDALIHAAYRQIFNEQQMTQSSRQLGLESQLRSGQISVRDFIVGLVSSDVFRKRNYETNNNYRLVQMCIQRVLGREVYNEQEKLAWSTFIATKGLNAFVDALVNSEEYLSNFGDNVVPYQRRRILPQRSVGAVSFAHMARYDSYHLANLPKPGFSSGFRIQSVMSPVRWDWQKQTPPAAKAIGTGIAYFGGAAIAAGLAATFLSFFGLLSL
jgi:phycobilisome rod-core linker protein